MRFRRRTFKRRGFKNRGFKKRGFKKRRRFYTISRGGIRL